MEAGSLIKGRGNLAGGIMVWNQVEFEGEDEATTLPSVECKHNNRIRAVEVHVRLSLSPGFYSQAAMPDAGFSPVSLPSGLGAVPVRDHS